MFPTETWKQVFFIRTIMRLTGRLYPQGFPRRPKNQKVNPLEMTKR